MNQIGSLYQLFVSMIINNYNYDRFLTEAINSAINQTYPHTEIIVVDDGSTDNSRDIIARYSDCAERTAGSKRIVFIASSLSGWD
ncbi:MAG: glycosyltransferase family 2 protein [Dolichospermum sp.]